MAGEDNKKPPLSDMHEAVSTDDETAQFAQTYRELAKGEQTATQLEANLTVLESKLEAMLQALEDKAEDAKANAGEQKKAKNGGS
ncbi:hypothetical protein E4U21_005014 [Claviceps maximensis]|nr:hypothetical protein E4U21_005014 [Claviceps maximensis]